MECETPLLLSTPSSSQYRIFLSNATKRALTFGRKAPGDGRVGIPDAKNSGRVRTFAEPDIRGCIRQRARVCRHLPRPPRDNASGINCAQTVPLIIRARPANNNNDNNTAATRVYRVCAWTVVRRSRVECRCRMSKTVTVPIGSDAIRDIGI